MEADDDRVPDATLRMTHSEETAGHSVARILWAVEKKPALRRAMRNATIIAIGVGVTFSAGILFAQLAQPTTAADSAAPRLATESFAVGADTSSAPANTEEASHDVDVLEDLAAHSVTATRAHGGANVGATAAASTSEREFGGVATSATLVRLTTHTFGRETRAGVVQPRYVDHLAWVVRLPDRRIPIFGPMDEGDAPADDEWYETDVLVAVDAATGEVMFAFAN